MKSVSQINLTFEQVLEIVRQLTRKDKIKLSKELEKDVIDSNLTTLLKSFKTNELDEGTINQEVEIVRRSLHDKK